MEGTTGFENHEEVLKCVAMLQNELKVTTTKALGSLRAWTKANGIELPKMPRIAKEPKIGFGGHYGKILAHVMELKGNDKDIDKKALVAFCHENGIPEAYSATSLNMVHFAKQWSGEIAQAEEATEEVAEAA